MLLLWWIGLPGGLIILKWSSAAGSCCFLRFSILPTEFTNSNISNYFDGIMLKGSSLNLVGSCRVKMTCTVFFKESTNSNQCSSQYFDLTWQVCISSGKLLYVYWTYIWTHMSVLFQKCLPLTARRDPLLVTVFDSVPYTTCISFLITTLHFQDVINYSCVIEPSRLCKSIICDVI